jgi:hypothetical protein
VRRPEARGSNVASKEEDTANSVHRKLARGFAARDLGVEPITTPGELQWRTLSACGVSFEKRWGSAFQDHGELSPVSPRGLTGEAVEDFRNKAWNWFKRERLLARDRRGLGTMFVRSWAADCQNMALERACRERYQAVRDGDLVAIDEARSVLEKEPDGTGGLAAQALRLVLLRSPVARPVELPSLAEIEARYPDLAARDRRGGRSAFVARFTPGHPVLGAMTDRELAEAGILAGVWPEDWAALFDRLDRDGLITEARVIEEAETGIRSARSRML